MYGCFHIQDLSLDQPFLYRMFSKYDLRLQLHAASSSVLLLPSLSLITSTDCLSSLPCCCIAITINLRFSFFDSLFSSLFIFLENHSWLLLLSLFLCTLYIPISALATFLAVCFYALPVSEQQLLTTTMFALLSILSKYKKKL